MDWKKIAPWNWFREEQSSTPGTATPAGLAPDSLAALRSEMERFFGDSLQRPVPGLAPLKGLLRPSVDISEGKKAYTVRAELPGVALEDVSLEAEGQKLVIRAEKRQESEEDEEGYHCVERSYGAVQRVLSLPDDADSGAIEARLKNGVLRLRIPKQPARASQGRSIEIQGG